MGAVLGLHLQQVLAVEIRLALRDLVKRVTHENGTQRRLAGAVGSHDGMRLTVVNHKVDAL